MRRSVVLLLAALALACGTPQRSAQSGPAAKRPSQATSIVRVAWQERFAGPLDWIAPAGDDPEVVASVLRVEHDGPLAFLHAAHDARAGTAKPPPAVHFGKSFREDPIPLERVVDLRWRWRVGHHPDVTDDPWRDVAASVYVITKVPGVFSGRGFKFGWLAKPGPAGTTQRGLLQVELRSNAASTTWREETADVCALHREAFGPCEGEHVLYVGVVTDADNTDSLSVADYADFVLRVN